MVKKHRIKIPLERASEVLFLHNHACCVCNSRNDPVQIHHINENPADNRIENLCVLCLSDHNRTQTRGGFGRHLSASEVKRYRDDWVIRVRQQRDRIDEDFVKKAANGIVDAGNKSWNSPRNASLIPILNGIIATKIEVHARAYPMWDSGVTQKMNQGGYDVIDVYEQLWVQLSRWFPQYHFDHMESRIYISKVIGNQFAWHRSVNQPEGDGTGGTILILVMLGGVMDDISRMISETVQSLSTWLEIEDFDYHDWKVKWDAAEERVQNNT